MLLAELHGYKQYLGKTLYHTLLSLSEKGVRFKNGAYGFVVKAPGKDYVYKVWTYDPALESWLKYAQANQNDKYVVKLLSPIRELKITVAKPTKDFVLKYVKMEKLEVLPDKLYGLISNAHDAVKDMFSDEQDIDMTSLKRYMPHDWREDVELNKGFFETYLRVAEVMVKSSQHVFDAHADNVMWREDKLCMVITDPASKKGGYNGITAPDLMMHLDTELKRA